MSEIIVAASVSKPNVQTTLVVTDSEPIGMGIEDKRLIYANVLGRSAMGRDDTSAEHPVTLLERVIDEERPYDVNQFVQNWRALQQAGIPVPPTVRIVNEDTLLVTDVKADGSEVYGKGLALVLEGLLDGIRSRAHRDIDPLFLDITSAANIGDVAEKLEEYVQRANRAGIILAFDDPVELIVRPDGTWDLIALDFARVELLDNTDADIQKTIEFQNDKYASPFLKDIIAIHSNLALSRWRAKAAR